MAKRLILSIVLGIGLVAALATGCLAAELAWVATYYNVRWMVRYVLVARRLGGVR